ncbi:MAG: Rap1a/Tai family immunity protein [Candidatus Acidiferrales bacterium]
MQVFVKFLDDHPEELNRPAALLLAEALHEAFPCGK